MKASVKAAINKELKALGIDQSDYAHPSWCENGIALCTEGDNAHLIGDYYGFGISEKVEAIARKHGCYCEWYNPAVICIEKI